MRVEILPVTGLGEIVAGDDLGALIAAAAADPMGSIGGLADGDVVVVSSKIVSKALGLSVAAPDRESSIAAASVRLVARRRTPHGLAQIVQAAAGPVMAAAGVDNSNVAAGTVLLLPVDPDAQAVALRARIHELTALTADTIATGATGAGLRSGLRFGVVVSDTAGRAWRNGQTDLALGAAGIAITDDLRGAKDTHGQPMEVTVRAIIDEIAAAADLVKGKLLGVPVAVLRGLDEWVQDADGPGAASLLRPAREDWFRLGHVEAVRAALGVDPAQVDPPSVPADDVATRLARVLEVAMQGGLRLDGDPGQGPELALLPAESGPGAPGDRHIGAQWGGVTSSARTALCTQTGTSAELSLVPQELSLIADELTMISDDPGPQQWLELGALSQRVSAAAWSEDLVVTIVPTPGPPPTLHIAATTA